jgi:hypothetical protein
MARTAIVQKTAIFKIHNPSVYKRGLLDLALARYGEAYNLLLEKCKPIAEKWVEAAKAGERLPSLHRASKQIRPICPGGEEFVLPGSLRDGLIVDVTGNILSFCKLMHDWKPDKEQENDKGKPRYPAPVYGYQEDAYERTLAEAASWASDHFDFIDFQSRLTKEAKEVVRPLNFCRLRDFNLEHLEKDRWGIILNLQPKGFKPTKLRFPLAFGEWHEEEYLGKGAPKCAHLCKREGEYFLHVSFEFKVEVMERGEQQAYLGIDRGIIEQAAFALVGLDGRVLQTGALGQEVRVLQVALGKYREEEAKAGRRVSRKDWQKRHQDEILHRVANTIIALASDKKALVVIENLKGFRLEKRRVRSRYERFAGILEYKLKLAGLLKQDKVFAAYTSQICSKCGNIGKRDKKFFHCDNCGAEFDADKNAAINIARRGLYKPADWKNLKFPENYFAFHRSFASVG